MKIRPGAARDLEAVRICAEEAYARYIPVIGKDPAPLTADFEAQIADGLLHVAEGTDGLLGFIVFYPVEGDFLLESVAVRPAVAGQGVGKALIRFCEAQGRAQGAAYMRLYTHSKMTENLAIYPKLGYIETDRRRQDGFDRVFFRKALT